MREVPAKPEVYAKYDELLEAVAKQSGLSVDAVRKVLTLSFPSTRAYIMQEAQKDQIQGCAASIGRISM